MHPPYQAKSFRFWFIFMSIVCGIQAVIFLIVYLQWENPKTTDTSPQIALVFLVSWIAMTIFCAVLSYLCDTYEEQKIRESLEKSQKELLTIVRQRREAYRENQTLSGK